MVLPNEHRLILAWCDILIFNDIPEFIFQPENMQKSYQMNILNLEKYHYLKMSLRDINLYRAVPFGRASCVIENVYGMTKAAVMYKTFTRSLLKVIL